MELFLRAAAVCGTQFGGNGASTSVTVGCFQNEVVCHENEAVVTFLSTVERGEPRLDDDVRVVHHCGSDENKFSVELVLSHWDRQSLQRPAFVHCT